MVEMREYSYKQVGEVSLAIRIYSAEDGSGASPRPAVVFYFGGGWRTGSIDQFMTQSRYLAEKGFVAITPEYRVSSRYPVTPYDCVADAKDALYWVWQNCVKLGVDPKRIAVAGGSAGGHLALCTALLRQPEYDNREIYKIPQAIVLFNPVCDTTAKGFMAERMGDRAEEISPMHHIVPGAPPTLIFHGTSDITVPFASITAFCERMRQFGNACTVIPYEGRVHRFFNLGQSTNDEDYLDTRERMGIFLENQFLAPPLPKT